jgi:hypothetical protein
MRWVSAVAFVALTAAAIYAVPEDWSRHHETAWTAGLLVVYFAAGALVGRWWALILAFVPVLVAIPAGVRGDADGTPGWWWVLVDTVFIFMWVMLVGVLAGWAWRRRHMHAAGPRLSPQ